MRESHNQLENTFQQIPNAPRHPLNFLRIALLMITCYSLGVFFAPYYADCFGIYEIGIFSPVLALVFLFFTTFFMFLVATTTFMGFNRLANGLLCEMYLDESGSEIFL
ncbi:hypothetical protein BGZ96_009588 [Linnemannia gamsii]|uniref:Uncharacterized protein n=1 Tax=Linnemannia gamsii TaxID=64522 RepID=A0ABQ7KDB5_9FUNG|nr:hypothetical protein BGZ96_009588 [Linnemannia gamsii]